MIKLKSKEKSWTFNKLLELPRGTELYTLTRHVSRSGMFRRISVFYVDADMGIREILGFPELNIRYDSQECGFRMQGCGMDMGYHLVERMSQEVHGEGNYFKHVWL